MRMARTMMWLLLLNLLLLSASIRAAEADEDVCDEEDPNEEPQKPPGQTGNGVPSTGGGNGVPSTGGGNGVPSTGGNKPPGQTGNGVPSAGGNRPPAGPTTGNSVCADKNTICSAVKSLCTNEIYLPMMISECALTCSMCEAQKHLPGKGGCTNKSMGCFRDIIKKKCNDAQIKMVCPWTCGVCR